MTSWTAAASEATAGRMVTSLNMGALGFERVEENLVDDLAPRHRVKGRLPHGEPLARLLMGDVVVVKHHEPVAVGEGPLDLGGMDLVLGFEHLALLQARRNASDGVVLTRI